MSYIANLLKDFQELISQFETKKSYSKNEHYQDIIRNFEDLKAQTNTLNLLLEQIKPLNYKIELTHSDFNFFTIDTNTIYSYKYKPTKAESEQLADLLSSLFSSFGNAVNTAKSTGVITDMPEDLNTKIQSFDNEKYNPLYEKVPPVVYNAIPIQNFEFLNNLWRFKNYYEDGLKELKRLERKEFLSSDTQIKFKKNASKLESILEKSYDKQSIINNILNGHSYVSFIIKRDHDNSNIYLLKKQSTCEIPNFNEKTIYLPFIQKAEMEDYLQYEELKHLSIKDIGNDFITINIEESLALLEKNPVISFKRELEEKKSVKNFKNDYLTILNFIRQNYQHEISDKAIMINFNFSKKTIFIDSFSNCNEKFNYNNTFYFSQETKKELFSLFKRQWSIEKDFIDIPLMLEFISTHNNIKDF